MTGKWISAWTLPEVKGGAPSKTISKRTARLVISTTVTGSAIRVYVSNSHGNTCLRVDSASVCLCNQFGTFTGTPVRLLFSGKEKLAIPAGQVAVSDPVNLSLKAGSYVAISLYFSGDVESQFGNFTPNLFDISAPGDYTLFSTLDHSTTVGAVVDMFKRISRRGKTVLTPCSIITGVDIFSVKDTATSVALLSDGTGEGTGFASALSSAIQRRRAPHQLVDCTVTGAKLTDMAHRLDSEVFSREGVSHIILLGGKFDCLGARSTSSAREIVSTYKSIVNRAHKQGIKVIGCTLPPLLGVSDCTPVSAQCAAKVNSWLRTKGVEYLDGFVDIATILSMEGSVIEADRSLFEPSGEPNKEAVLLIASQFENKKWFRD